MERNKWRFLAARPAVTALAIAAANTNDATDNNPLNKMNHFPKDDLRAGMELLKDTHEEAYLALREASQVDDAGSRKGKGAGNKPTPPATDIPA